MGKRGIGVEGVASHIGGMCACGSGCGYFRVEREELIKGICQRFEATRQEAERAIRRAFEVGAVHEQTNEDGKTIIVLNMEEKK